MIKQNDKLVCFFHLYLFKPVRSCETLTAPAGGEIVGNCINTYGSICQFRCDEGRNLTGSSTRTCSIDGSDKMVWSGDVVTCPGIWKNITYTIEISTKESVSGILNYFAQRKQQLPFN